eukprot:m.98600 g.98600  ORF g.98600 m.98600 type:complete len:803 (+) comp12524_c0_seq1:115-2523(+)
MANNCSNVEQLFEQLVCQCNPHETTQTPCEKLRLCNIWTKLRERYQTKNDLLLLALQLHKHKWTPCDVAGKGLRSRPKATSFRSRMLTAGVDKVVVDKVLEMNVLDANFGVKLRTLFKEVTSEGKHPFELQKVVDEIQYEGTDRLWTLFLEQSQRNPSLQFHLRIFAAVLAIKLEFYLSSRPVIDQIMLIGKLLVDSEMKVHYVVEGALSSFAWEELFAIVKKCVDFLGEEGVECCCNDSMSSLLMGMNAAVDVLKRTSSKWEENKDELVHEKLCERIDVKREFMYWMQMWQNRCSLHPSVVCSEMRQRNFLQQVQVNLQSKQDPQEAGFQCEGGLNSDGLFVEDVDDELKNYKMMREQLEERVSVRALHVQDTKTFLKLSSRSICNSRKYGRSYFEAPYLLSSAVKLAVIRLESSLLMSKQYFNAFFNQAVAVEVTKVYDTLETAAPTSAAKFCPYLMLDVRRDYLFEDTFNALTQCHGNFHSPLKVRFIGGGETGLDYGGVQKEFFEELMETFHNSDNGMFVVEEDTNYMWIQCPLIVPISKYFYFGVLLGLALYNNIIVNLRFPDALFKFLLFEELDENDFEQIFPTIHSSHNDLLTMDDASLVCSTFAISRKVFGQMKEFPLCENGESIDVTNDNRDEYVKLKRDFMLRTSITKQLNAIRDGFYRVIVSQGVGMCSHKELQLIMCGRTELDLAELKAGARYIGFSSEAQVAQWFWEVLEEYDDKMKRSFLHFVTGSERAPVSGLKNMHITLQFADDATRLPTSMTCFNRILLPPYKTKDQLRERLATAIAHGSGFGLV